jgi:hypothetical protein
MAAGLAILAPFLIIFSILAVLSDFTWDFAFKIRSSFSTLVIIFVHFVAKYILM